MFHETFGDFGFTMKARAVALRDLGPALSPTNAFHILTGIETLPLRMERHVANARAVAEFLAGHPAVAWVSLPGLPGSASHDLAAKYLPAAPGRCSRSACKGGFEAGVRLVEACRPVVAPRQRRRHPQPDPPPGLDDAPPAARTSSATAAGAGHDVIRLSVGIETVDDLIADLGRAWPPRPEAAAGIHHPVGLPWGDCQADDQLAPSPRDRPFPARIRMGGRARGELMWLAVAGRQIDRLLSPPG